MKQSLLKKISYIVCCTMTAGAIGATAVYAANEETGTAPGQKEEAAIEDSAADDTKAPEKDETVYVIADAYGSANKVIVSDWLKNTNGDSTMTEESLLEQVKNVKGDETFTESDGTRTWNANGNDIYYQGTTNAELPVKLSVSYKLDGRDITAAELVGKSGKVTIRFDYENTQYVTKTINGEETKIYVPFAAITGMMLDTDSFRNVETTNAKLVNDGSRTFVVGTAFPGMKESLGAKEDGKIKIPEYFEITADVKDFSLAGTVTVVTNEVFNDVDIDLGDKESSITEDIDKLSDAMNAIVDGSGALYDGLAQLLEKSGALTDGVSQLKDGAKKLDDGASQLYDGSVKLSSGLDELTSNNEALTAGSKQVFQSLLDLANAQIADAGITGHTLTIENYSEELTAIIDSVSGDGILTLAENEARKQVAAAVEAKRGYIRGEVEKVVRQQVSEKVNEAVREQVREKVTESVKEVVAEKVMAAVKDNVADKVDEAVREVVTGKITEAVDSAVAENVYNAVYNTVRSKVCEAVRATVAQKVEQAVRGTVTQKVTEAVRQQVFGAVLASKGISAEMLSKLPAETVSAINAAVDAQMETEAVQSKISAAVEAQMQSAEVIAQKEAAINAQMQSTDVQNIINAKIAETMASDEITAKIAEETAKHMDDPMIEEKVQELLPGQMGTDEVKQKEATAVEEQMQSDEVKQKFEEALEAQMKSDEVQAQIDKITDEKMNDPEVKAKAAAALEEKMKSDEVQKIVDENTDKKIAELIEENLKSDEVQAKIRDGLKDAEAGVQKLYDLKTQLDSYNTFYTGLAQYTDGVAAAADGAGQIKDGLDTLSTGTGDLYAGVEKMDESMPALIDGITKLTDGSKELADGCGKFSDEGVGKIVSLVDGDLGSIIDRFRAVKEASQDYQTFSGGNGEVKFVYKTAGIEADE